MSVVRGMLAIEVNPQALPEEWSGASCRILSPWQMAFLIRSGGTERYLKDNLEWFFNWADIPG